MIFYRIKLILSVFLVLISVILLVFNFYLIKNFNQKKSNLKTENIFKLIDLSLANSRKISSTNYASFVETDYSRDFYRYRCKNRTRLGANPMYVNNIPDKLYRIEGII
jgi:hypothetical protein